MATVTANLQRRYTDLDLNFMPHPVKRDVTKVVDEMAVINSVKNLILTNHYERLFHPEIGSNVQKLLFDNMDSITSATLEREITDVIRNFEPRVSVDYINISPDFDNNTYQVSMQFRILNKTEPISIKFFLERAR
jgi:phage baseplate assembly protein W